jgi:sugar/nucleoside kinase (ribokinase family)
VLTLGKKGAIHYAPPREGATRLQTEYLPALEPHAVDAVGAGDTFFSSMVLADIAGATPGVSLYLASLLAALKVRHLGNEPVHPDELVACLSVRPELTR